MRLTTLKRTRSFALARVEQVVDAQPQVEQMPRRDAGRIVDVVLGPIGGNDEPLGPASAPPPQW